MSRQVTERIPERAPAFFFIDIQPDQQQRFRAIVDGIPAVTEVRTTPMVRGRITRVNDVDAETLSVGQDRSEEHTSELPSLMRISYAVFCLKKKTFKI